MSLARSGRNEPSRAACTGTTCCSSAAGWPGRCVLPAGTNHAHRADRRGKDPADPNVGQVPGRSLRLRFGDDAVSDGVHRQETGGPLVATLGSGRRRRRRAQQGIIFLDEVDKLKRNDDSFGLDVAGYGAQIDLLPFLDGADVAVQRDKTIHIDTRRLFLVAAGAFVGIERVVERRLQEAGFTGLGPWKGLAGERLVAEHLVPGDVVCYGLCEEFVGRFSVVCTLDPLDADALRAILLEAQGSPLAEAQSFYAMHGIDLEFDDATIDAIVARALTEKAGAGAASDRG